MHSGLVKIIAVGVFALSSTWQPRAKEAKGPYPKMAPVEQYMIPDRNAEIALAQSAAPESISRDAEVLVLGRHGYETAVEGTNGFICLVERSWNRNSGDPEFWNPKSLGANCYNPPAAKSILPLILKRAEMALAGMSEEQIIDGIQTFGKKEVPALEPGAVCYMMSKESYLTDAGGHNESHLMFYVPAGTAWGADLSGSPVQQGEKLILGTPEPVTEYLIPMRKWSDGTPQ
ncbi:MAG TPA: hypothetical protein VGT03_03875 [Candidatus Acidoferrales bacterium]|nr:hypothetical protein [Candidatus Acidoferrales bacterium]